MFEKKASSVIPQPRFEVATSSRSLSPPPSLSGYLFYYQAVVRSVYDGDTITVDIDLGLRSWQHGEKVRLLRINAPELRGDSHEKGRASGDYLRNLVDGKPVILEVFKDDKEKYGRYLAEVWLQAEDGSWLNVNDLIVKAGHAEYHTY